MFFYLYNKIDRGVGAQALRPHQREGGLTQEAN
jgi:hypothetical protein